MKNTERSKFEMIKIIFQDMKKINLINKKNNVSHFGIDVHAKVAERFHDES